MAQRRAKGRQAVRNSSGGVPAWAWALVGAIAGGIFVVVLMHRSQLPMTPGPQANPQATAETPSEAGAVAPATTSSAAKKPQFDFYSVLSEKEVRIPDAEISAQAKAEQQKQAAAAAAAANAAPPAPTPTPNPATPVAGANGHIATQTVEAAPPAALPEPAGGGGYLLQIGAFPDAAKAESMKAQMAMQGFVANVQTVTVHGQPYHRVRLGPFASASALEATKQRLTAAGIPSIALKEGK
ncbi:MAG: SPOR domain-containing protein [Rhodanobacter sp.]|nr:MAG: SPOR domain-containing protein [Rhodanobacter sp.]TAM08254.1 MAG: SPOR domain-containing protein [Rhodanobacter sp.]TAM37101.1 MAG: SPOR domain-containing protein [Rhodanobacter sp.]